MFNLGVNAIANLAMGANSNNPGVPSPNNPNMYGQK